jgi:site-specific DNA recombinase
VDVVVVYKIDRLSRALVDFAKLVDVFDRNNVTFVSVTQSFNTTTSMGRLTLNILLSFAQFEREVSGERIRDKFRASRSRGMWMGGHPPLGYDVKDRKLVVNEPEAALVRSIFKRFVRVGSATTVARSLTAEGIRTKRHRPHRPGLSLHPAEYRTYIAEAVHKRVSYPGEHQPIIPRELWDKVHVILQESPRKRAVNTHGRSTPALLKGLLFGPNGLAFTPAYTRRGKRLYRYYVSTGVIKRGPEACPIRRVPAAEVESAVVDQIRSIISSPEIVERVWKEAHEQDRVVSEDQVRATLSEFSPLWDALFPTEQARIIQLLVERVEIQPDRRSVTLCADIDSASWRGPRH